MKIEQGTTSFHKNCNYNNTLIWKTMAYDPGLWCNKTNKQYYCMKLTYILQKEKHFIFSCCI